MSEREQPVPIREVARLYGVDERTVRNWIDAGCPHRKRSRRLLFVLSELVPWRREQDKRDRRDETAPDEAAERARKLRADADMAELRVRQKLGELVPAADVDRQVERICMAVRSRVLSVRGRWAPRVMGLGTMAEATTALDGLSQDILAALHEGADDVEQTEPEEEVA